MLTLRLGLLTFILALLGFAPLPHEKVRVCPIRVPLKGSYKGYYGDYRKGTMILGAS